ncbi:threonine--tRNA ligase [Spiroplasma endosymbiont of Aspidapion aeneum]|uniref:threonine--tRNA ligase n=1 Tax=Spiroplasma endosymbiont of Aspidapion aeneum TaxID=3066276 RepID=UPI00313DF300
MKVKLLDNKEIVLDENATVMDCAMKISKSLQKDCFGAIVNGVYYSYNSVLKEDSQVEILTSKNDYIYNNAIANSIRMVIAKSLIDNYRDLRIVNFEQDFSQQIYESKVLFDYSERFKLDDIKKIQLLVNKTISKVNKIEFLGEDIDKYEKDLILSYGDKKYVKEIFDYVKNNNVKVSIVKIIDSVFVSYYPYIENILNFRVELQSFAGEYWQGNSKNEMIQRLAFISGKNENDLKKRILLFEELKNNDHRFIGKNLEVFTFNDLIGQGLPIWLPNGYIIKETIKNYLKEKEWEYDFLTVETPVIGTSELYKISGHWVHYKDDMFSPMVFQKEELVLRPMTCPHHIQIYKSKSRSYKELPLRLAEHANLYRYESSGSLTGLERVRSMELTDSHIFVRKDQIKDEFVRCYKLIEETLSTFNIKIDYLSLSLRDKNDNEKYYQDDEMWDIAEKELESVLVKNNINFKKMIGEAAFYGPKLDVQIRTVLGHEITVSTIQLDFLLPQKFKLEYIANNKIEQPIIIHRGLVGTYERFIAILLEQTKGILPLWLAPTQIEIVPVAMDNSILKYCNILKDELKSHHIRAHVDARDERLNYKIRDAQIKKIPYQLVIGANEVKTDTISYRKYSSEEIINLKQKLFIENIIAEINNKGKK